MTHLHLALVGPEQVVCPVRPGPHQPDVRTGLAWLAQGANMGPHQMAVMAADVPVGVLDRTGAEEGRLDRVRVQRR